MDVYVEAETSSGDVNANGFRLEVDAHAFGKRYGGRAIGQEDGHRAVVRLAEEFAPGRSDEICVCLGVPTPFHTPYLARLSWPTRNQ